MRNRRADVPPEPRLSDCTMTTTAYFGFSYGANEANQKL